MFKSVFFIIIIESTLVLLLIICFLLQVNAVKFNEYASVVVSAGYDRSLRAWDCRSHSTEPIQVAEIYKWMQFSF